MLMQQEFMKNIKDFGLNSYEAKIWIALLSRGISSAGELSDISGVPRSRAYDVLESLEKKGFVMLKLGKPIKYMALPPKDVVDVLKKKVREEATSREKHMDGLKNSDVLQELTTLHTNGVSFVEHTDVVGMLRDRSNIYNYLENLIKNAKSYVYIMTSEKGLIRKFEDMRRAFKKAHENGVKIKILAPTTKATEKEIVGLDEYAELKHFSNITARFVIIDGEQTLFMITDDEEVQEDYDTGMWVNTPFFVNTLKDLFELNWKAAK